jgi:hypothetical protein
MMYPTCEEICAAAAGIECDGSGADTTGTLCAIVLTDPHLRAVVMRLMRVVKALSPSAAEVSGAALVASAIATGLNYGMRIHEQRVRTMTDARSRQ